MFWHQTSLCKCSMCLYCVGKVSDCFINAVVRVDWHACALSMHKQNPLSITRAITLIELDPNSYFFIINVYLEDINVFARSDEIPSLPVENMKDKPKCCRWTDRGTDGWTQTDMKTVYPPPTHTVCSGGGGIMEVNP